MFAIKFSQKTLTLNLNNLMTYDFVKEAVEADELKLQGAYFSIIKAQLLLSDDNGEFYEV